MVSDGDSKAFNTVQHVYDFFFYYYYYYYYYYHIAYVKRYSSLHTVQILTILMTQIFSITYRAPKDITYDTAIYIP